MAAGQALPAPNQSGPRRGDCSLTTRTAQNPIDGGIWLLEQGTFDVWNWKIGNLLTNRLTGFRPPVSPLHGSVLFIIIWPLFSGGLIAVTPNVIMPKSSLVIVLLAGLSLPGCASSPWSTKRPVFSLKPRPAPVVAADEASPPPEAPLEADPRTMQDVVAELQELGAVDPVAQNRLLEDLRQSDPSLWPLVVRQSRATMAYRQRALQRTGTVAVPERLPAVEEVAIARPDAPAETYPSSPDVPVALRSPVDAPAEQVFQASYTAPVAGNWQQQLAGAIGALEAEVPAYPTTAAERAQHARLRMLYAAAGRREDATRPIPATPPAAQQFLSKELEGLTAWLDVEQTPDAVCRAAAAKPALAQALAKLTETAPLVIHNLAFCIEVQSYGCVKRFDNHEFYPQQEVLLYAEVENFVSEPTPKGYHTSLGSSYRILDQQGHCVDEHTFAATEEYCDNVRRDFFIGYHLHLPKDVGPGRYTLRLSIKDLKSQKVGEASIALEIKERQEPQTDAEKPG